MRNKLNTNMSRNDYDSIRVVRDVPAASRPRLSAAGVYYVNELISIDDFPFAASKGADYQQYKMTNVQVVLTPRFSKGAFDNHKGLAAANADFYGAIWPRSHNDVPVGTPTWNTIKQTPGVRLFKLDSGKRVVLNLAPYVDLETPSNQGRTLGRRIPLGWSDYLQGGLTPNFKLCPWGVYIPQAAPQGDGAPVIDWNMEIYATFIFRGNTDYIPDA